MSPFKMLEIAEERAVHGASERWPQIHGLLCEVSLDAHPARLPAAGILVETETVFRIDIARIP